jgi:transposase
MQDAAASVLRHEGRILHFWNNRSTNAFAESFNAKLKNFRNMLRGVRDLQFFLFRCEVYFA